MCTDSFLVFHSIADIIRLYADYRKQADRYPNTHPNPYTTFRGFIIGSLIHTSKS
ncbi:MAG: hypothetical protein IJ989_02200 [Paludibacteraceae bacterium]|nr:hypothetical protein [Paludibacteraceae bacterium]